MVCNLTLLALIHYICVAEGAGFEPTTACGVMH